MKLLLSVALALIGFGQPVLGPYSAATNHSDDILGTPDTRPSTWGTAGYSVHELKFHPPHGYRTRILRVYGDVQGWVRKNPSGNCAGVLWGLTTTAKDGSERVSPAADNTFLYVQDAICERRPFRAPVDYKIDRLLEADNILISKVAVWLNETGEPVHIEPSFVVVYQFERQ